MRLPGPQLPEARGWVQSTLAVRQVVEAAAFRFRQAQLRPAEAAEETPLGRRRAPQDDQARDQQQPMQLRTLR